MSRSNDSWALIWLFKFLSLAVLLAACSDPPPAPTTGNGLATGLSVSPEFQGFYDQNGGARVFGFPISMAFVEPDSGRLTQYFQNLRLEFDQVAGTVIVSRFGELFAPPEEEWEIVLGSPNGNQQTFPETGFTVRGAFLAFYEANGGQPVFGSPITPQLDEGGKLVQYFENAQLIWNPNALPEFRVEVASLADAYYWQFGGPTLGSFTRIQSAAILEADVQAAVKEPILYAGEAQVLYVTVITPDSLQLVEGATVSVTISYDGLSTEMIFANLTDELGQAQDVLEMPGVAPGDTVMVEIEAIGATGVLGSTMLSFRTWW